jgi:hypothetical protein
MAPFDVHFPPFVPKASTFRRGTPPGPPGSAPAYPRCPHEGCDPARRSLHLFTLRLFTPHLFTPHLFTPRLFTHDVMVDHCRVRASGARVLITSSHVFLDSELTLDSQTSMIDVRTQRKRRQEKNRARYTRHSRTTKRRRWRASKCQPRARPSPMPRLATVPRGGARPRGGAQSAARAAVGAGILGSLPGGGDAALDSILMDPQEQINPRRLKSR